MVSKTLKLFDTAAWSTLLQVIGGSLFLALCARITIPLFFTPIPLSLQTFAVMLLGITLGRRNATLAVLFYIAECSMGLPFTAKGVNPLVLISPTGGYVLGFIVQAYLAGCIKDFGIKASHLILAALSLSCIIQLSIGCAWLTQFVGVSNVLAMGFYPFLIGDGLKCLALTSLRSCSKSYRS